jgi:hypothetical protein
MDTTTTMTNTVTATVTRIPGTSRRTGRPSADPGYELCWCGQVMDAVHGTHCPRCGTMRAARSNARVGALLPRLAA